MPLANKIVEVPKSKGFAFLFRDDDFLLMDLEDPFHPFSPKTWLLSN
jgi:splicing factor 3B subunit 3